MLNMSIFAINNSSDSGVSVYFSWSSGRNVWLSNDKIGFDYESGSTNNSKVGIHSFPVPCLALNRLCREQDGSYVLSAPLGKAPLSFCKTQQLQYFRISIVFRKRTLKELVLNPTF